MEKEWSLAMMSFFSIVVGIILSFCMNTPCSRTDFNKDGRTDVIDAIDWINAYNQGDMRCDWDRSGTLTGRDQIGYSEAWFKCIG